MATVTLKGGPVQVGGTLPTKGSTAPDFVLVNTSLADVALAEFAGKRKILNIFPSVDTATCAMSVRQFNEKASSLDNTVVLCISADLPFAQARFCGAEGIQKCSDLIHTSSPRVFKQLWCGDCRWPNGGLGSTCCGGFR